MRGEHQIFGSDGKTRREREYDQDDPRQIERELNETRRRIDQTVYTIERRLSPGELLDQGIRYFRRGPGAFGRNLGHTLRDHPVPAVLVGIGLTWLALGESEAIDIPIHDERRGHGRLGGRMRERIEHGKDRLADSLERGKQQVGETIERRAKERRSRHTMRRVRRATWSRMQENPLMLAALGVAAGAILGGLMPTSHTERAVLGDASRRARRRGRELTSRAGEVAKQAMREGVQRTEQTETP